METVLIKLPPVISAALEVLSGVYGNGEERKQRLEAAGYDYQKIQKCVNDLIELVERYN